MAEEHQEVSSKTFFDLPLYDVIVPLITRDLNDRDLLAMWKAVAKFQAYRETIEEIIGAKRHLTVSEVSPDKELFPIAVRTCRQLRSIKINFYKLRQNWNKYLVKLVADNPLISEIFIKRGTWERFLKVFTNAQISLRRVILASVNTKDEDLSVFFAQQPFLQSIALANMRHSFSNSLFTIGQTCHELEVIDMTTCERTIINEDDVWYIVENCPKLRTFLIPTSLLHLLWVFSTDTIDLLFDRNIEFCTPDDLLLLQRMDERRRNAEA